MGIAAAWLPDPTGRHQHRYWSGDSWTTHVADDGVQATDLPDGEPQTADSSPVAAAAETIAPGSTDVQRLGDIAATAATQALAGVEAQAEKHRQPIVSALQRFQNSASGLSTFFKRATVLGLGSPVIWVIALAIPGWLLSIGGILLLLVIIGAWLVASFGVWNLSMILAGMGNSMQRAVDKIQSFEGVSPELQSLAETLRGKSKDPRGQLQSARQLRQRYRTLRTGLETVTTIRSFNPAGYGFGLASLIALMLIAGLGLLVALVALLVVAYL